MKTDKKKLTKAAARRNARRDRELAQIDALLTKLIPFNEWIARRNPTEAQKELYRDMVSGFKEMRQRLITHGPDPRVITVRDGRVKVS